MVNIAKSPHVKLCLSSRPWNCFEDVLGRNNDRKLYLQDLTREDIKIYAKTKLKRPADWASTHDDQAHHQAFVLEIVERAQGVFLWVFLVVRSLQEGLANGDTVSMLEKRLRTLPTDLEPFFEHILNSVDKVYQEKMGAMFQVALQANEPASLLTYSFLDEEDIDFSIKLPPSELVLVEIQSRQDDTRRRINGRSKGLLEVTSIHIDGYTAMHHTVDFLHRTVRDFLNTRHMCSVLEDMSPSTYNACFALSRALLATFKTMDPHFLKNKAECLNLTLEYARRAEEQRGVPDNPMIEELERTAKVRFHLFLESRNAFLGYTISRGLVQYVNSKLNQQPQLPLSERGILLNQALPKPLVPELLEIDLTLMVKMLLKRGWNPNDTLGSSTVWHRFFNSYPSVDAETREYEYWRRILKLLLLWGANIQEAFKLFELMMKTNEMVQSSSTSSKEMVRTVELLLSHGLDPNQPMNWGRTTWTAFLEKIMRATIFWDEYMVQGVAKAFLRYGANPLASYYKHSIYSTEVEQVSTALSEIADSQMQKLIDDETAYFRSREWYSKKSPSSRPRESHGTRQRFVDLRR